MTVPEGKRDDGLRPMPDVTKACPRCGVKPEHIASGYVLVSPRGIAHHGCDGGGLTACGIDATGDKWWWPL